MKRKTRMKAIADFLQKVLPEPASSSPKPVALKTSTPPPPPPLLTRKNLDPNNNTTDDPKKYKRILELSNVHLTDYQSVGDIQITRGSKYHDVIAPLFPHIRRRVIETALQRRWARY